MRDLGVGDGPNKIRDAGLVSGLEAQGITVRQHTLSDVDDLTGEIGRSFGLLRQVSTAVKRARSRDSFPLIIAGNCMTSVGVACALGPASLNYVAFDAHEDLHTPSTTTSGYFDGMGWSVLAGDSYQAMARTIPGFQAIELSKHLILCGTRDCTEIERKLIANYGVDTIWGSEDGNDGAADALARALRRKTNLPTLIHLDLDVLDDEVGKANAFAAPHGLSVAQLKTCMRAVVGHGPVVGMTVASFDPTAGSSDVIAAVAAEVVSEFVMTMIQRDELVGREESSA